MGRKPKRVRDPYAILTMILIGRTPTEPRYHRLPSPHLYT